MLQSLGGFSLLREISVFVLKVFNCLDEAHLYHGV